MRVSTSSCCCGCRARATPEHTSTADQWAAEFDLLAKRTRAYTGRDFTVVVGHIADQVSPSTPAGYATVRAAQSVRGEIDAVIDTDGFTMRDILHFGATGQIAIGQAFHAAAFG